MNILIAMNDAFVKCYRVMMASLCINNSDEAVTFYLPDTGKLSREGLSALRKTAEDYDAGLEVLDCAGVLEGFEKLPVGMWSVEMFFRLLAQDFLPADVDRILWLDGDIIVNGSIRKLYYTDFCEGGAMLYAACEDKAISRGKIREEYDSLGWDDDRIYYNSGVLLINVAGLRKMGITGQQVLDCAVDNVDRLHYPDQYILNCMFHDKIKPVDEFTYNCQVSSHPYTEGRRILSQSAILHFPGYRPWSVDYQRHYSSAIPGDIWWRYARQCGEGKGYIKWKILNTIKVKPWQAAYRLGKLLGK
jgi:lipopolysaccharide biosynthesis glycosyltransferase